MRVDDDVVGVWFAVRDDHLIVSAEHMRCEPVEVREELEDGASVLSQQPLCPRAVRTSRPRVAEVVERERQFVAARQEALLGSRMGRGDAGCGVKLDDMAEYRQPIGGRAVLAVFTRRRAGTRVTTFARDGAVIESTSTLRFRDRPEIEASLVDAGFEVAEIGDAPDRPLLEFVFVARRSVRTRR